MGTVTSIFAQPKQTYSVDEQNKIREVRRNFNDVIQNYHKRALELKEKSELTPESAERILFLSNDSLDWLSKNPSASVLDLQASQDNYRTSVTDVLETDKIKATFIGFYKGLLLAIEQKGNVLTKKETDFLKNESTVAEKWFEQNKLKTNRIQLEQYIFNAQTRTVQAMESTVSKKIINDLFDDLKKKKPAKIGEDLAKVVEARETLESNQFDAGILFDELINTALKVIIGSLIFIVFLFSGSLAANSAIYRPVSIRVLYFIWGMIPLFVVPIFIYFAIQRVRSGPLPFYGLFPIMESTEIYENGLGFMERFFRSAVVYYKDDRLIALKKNYCDSLKAFAL